MVEELREQIIEEGEELEYVEENPLKQLLERLLNPFTSLVQWQRLVLALLVFLNVALCGCMLLVMTGRIFPPF
jgi:hypothetical protein